MPAKKSARRSHAAAKARRRAGWSLNENPVARLDSILKAHGFWNKTRIDLS
jgi:hypothetical protein